MDLLPPEVRAAFARFPIGSQEGAGDDARVLTKFFFPAGRYTFLVTEAELEGDDYLLFGYCVSALGADCDEWGYASLSELRSVCVRGLTMERDLDVLPGERTVGQVLGRVRKAENGGAAWIS